MNPTIAVALTQLKRFISFYGNEGRNQPSGRETEQALADVEAVLVQARPERDELRTHPGPEAARSIHVCPLCGCSKAIDRILCPNCLGLAQQDAERNARGDTLRRLDTRLLDIKRELYDSVAPVGATELLRRFGTDVDDAHEVLERLIEETA